MPLDFVTQSADEKRVATYHENEKLFLGEHEEIFTKKKFDSFIKDEKLRYVAVNFAGMISKLCADMLFQEFPKISVSDKNASKFLEALMTANNLKTQLYESGLENSYRGDAVFRIRSLDGTLLIEDMNPVSYFPSINKGNVREEPKEHVFQWTVELAGLKGRDGKPAKALLKERHLKGKVITELWLLNDKGETISSLNVDAYGYTPEVDTKITDFLVVHIPNFRINSSFFGISDYKDLMALFRAINNRLTKVDSILDKHGDPILAVPPGVLDDEGKVRKQSFGVIEVDTSESMGGKPEYIVWDAKLESAFAEIDKLVEFLFLTSETSQAAFGLDKQGQAESGRALKFKLLRTIAKMKRKQLYYDTGIKRLLMVAQDFAKANNLTCDDVKMKGTVSPVQIEWNDGVVNDYTEQLDDEIKALDAGLTTKKDAISRLEGVSDEEAEKKLEEIRAESEKDAPKFAAGVTDFTGKGSNVPPTGQNGGKPPKQAPSNEK